MEKAATRVIALNGIVNAKTMIVVFNNGDPLKIVTNFQEKPARRIAIIIENIAIIEYFDSSNIVYYRSKVVMDTPS